MAGLSAVLVLRNDAERIHDCYAFHWAAAVII
jgi:hypothetical protein